MQRWKEKVAVVTGASSGIGSAIVIDLLKSHMIVIGLARRVERIEKLSDEIPENLKHNLYAKKCDVTSETEVKNIFKWITNQFGGCDVLINNAGILRKTYLLDETNTIPIKEIIDTNLWAVILCTREAFKSMKEKNTNGHIILMNSIAGHKVLYAVNSNNLYPGTKHAITAITEVLRQEFQLFDTQIKVTSISPGFVKTEIFSSEELELMKEMPFLETSDISSAVLYVLGTPSHVQIHEMIIKPIGEKY